jgi:hypothetical protein
VEAEFGKKRMALRLDDLLDFTPAWALCLEDSFHASFPGVVVVLDPEKGAGFTRRGLYAALRLGERISVLIGPPSALGRALADHDEREEPRSMLELHVPKHEIF